MIYFLLMFQINQSVMEAALSPDMLATDLAYYLVRKGVSSVSAGKLVCFGIYLYFVMVLHIFLCCRYRSERLTVSLVRLCLQLNPKISP